MGMKEDLEAAFEEVSEEEENEEQEEEEQDEDEGSSDDESGDEGEGEEEGDSDEGDDDSDEGEESDDEESEDDDAGEEEEEGDGEGGEADEGESGSDEDSGSAPASWDPQAREDWDKIPAHVKEQINKREREITETLGTTSQARQVAQAWTGLLQPYQAIIQSQGSTPYQTVSDLLRIAGGLVMGTPAQKASVVDNIISQYNVDVAELDQAISNRLEGRTPSSPQHQQQDVNSVVQQALQNERQQQQQQAVQNEIAVFKASGEAEFFDTVQPDIALLMQSAAQRGEDLSLKDAYAKACQMNDSVRTVLQQREDKKKEAERKKRLAKKKKAASSIKGKQRGSKATKKPTTRAGDIAAAWDQLDGANSGRI